MNKTKAFGSASGVTLIRDNPATPANGLAAYIASTFNSGWQTADIRRCLLSSNLVESITATELVVNGTFDTGTSGWETVAGTSALSNGGGYLVVTNTGGFYGRARTSSGFATSLGKTYAATLTCLAGAMGVAVGLVNATDNAGISGAAVYLTAGQTKTIYLTATAASTDARLRFECSSNVAGDACWLDNISVKEVVPDRSYKAAGANIYGTLTKSAVATAAQLVAYSGFSAANYVQEPYSSDLDFGTGSWNVSAWVNTTGYGPHNMLTFPEDLTKSSWIKPGSVNVTSASTVNLPQLNEALANNVTVAAPQGASFTFMAELSGSGTVYIGASRMGAGTYEETRKKVTLTNTPTWYSVSHTIINPNQTGINSYISRATDGTATTVSVTGSQLTRGLNAIEYRAGLTAPYNGTAPIAERSAATGPRITLSLDSEGRLAAEAYDGTTTRRVTSPAAYNTGTWLKARATYNAGKLAITVNGVEVASTVGAPLLTMNNSNAVLTIGNSRTLDAPFPGSIALLKLGATVPSPEQAAWMYEQEKQMFRDGAQITLPAATAVTDLAYDQSRDRWVAVQSGNESSFTGLVRTATSTPTTGNFSKVSATSGVKLLARTTTSPGVDVTIPAYGLREELVKRGEAAAKASKTLTVFDFDTIGFTATTTNASNQLTLVASVVGTPYLGMGITGTGIPAGTTITGINGTTYTLSANATAAGTAVTMGQTDFTLPVGYVAKDVLSVGARKREGTTKDWVRLFDGFRETVRFAVSPGSAAWVQINAAKE